VAHSLSPSMQNAAIRVLGLDAVYVALRTSAPELTTVLAALAAVGGAGNVTVPHKEAAERCVARKTAVCARAGACNTFWTDPGQRRPPTCRPRPRVRSRRHALGAHADRSGRAGAGRSRGAAAPGCGGVQPLLHG